MKELILIGGAAGTGKTTLARRLAKQFELPWISTDQIRSILRAKEADQMVLLEKTWQGVLALVENHHPWEGGVIEGTAILPEFVVRDLKGKENIRTIFLVHPDDERIAEMIEERSKLPWINTKTSEQKAEKLREISAHNTVVIETAGHYQLPCIQIQGDGGAVLKEALALLGRAE